MYCLPIDNNHKPNSQCISKYHWYHTDSISYYCRDHKQK